MYKSSTSLAIVALATSVLALPINEGPASTLARRESFWMSCGPLAIFPAAYTACVAAGGEPVAPLTRRTDDASGVSGLLASRDERSRCWLDCIAGALVPALYGGCMETCENAPSVNDAVLSKREAIEAGPATIIKRQNHSPAVVKRQNYSPAVVKRQALDSAVLAGRAAEPAVIKPTVIKSAEAPVEKRSIAKDFCIAGCTPLLDMQPVYIACVAGCSQL